MPPIQPGFRIQKRPIPTSAHLLQRKQPSSATCGEYSAFDPDGYLPPQLSPHTSVIRISASAPFMSLVRRVRKKLEKSTRGGLRTVTNTKGLPLAVRLDALAVQNPSLSSDESSDAVWVANDVILVGTGRAIQKAVEVGGFFTCESDLVVSCRTRTLTAVDDIVAGSEADVEDVARIRNLSCMEVGIRWRVGVANS